MAVGSDLIHITPLGDRALTVHVAEGISLLASNRVRMLYQSLSKAASNQGMLGIQEYVPAFSTLTVVYNPLQVSFGVLYEFIASVYQQEVIPRSEYVYPVHPADAEEHILPVCYAPEVAPDLATVAEKSGLSTAEVVALHSQATYTVAMVGFTPGFTYLLGLDARLHTPRLSSPRIRVPAGSVAIGGSQTGIYSLQSPGGWNIIGRTPITLFNPYQTNPQQCCRFQASDVIRIQAISLEEFHSFFI